MKIKLDLLQDIESNKSKSIFTIKLGYKLNENEIDFIRKEYALNIQFEKLKHDIYSTTFYK